MLSAIGQHESARGHVPLLSSIGLSFPARYEPIAGTRRSANGKSVATNTGYTSPAGGITPAQMEGAYGASGIMFGSTVGNGSGETIAILDPGDDTGLVNSTSSSFSSSDLAIFDKYWGLPNPPSFTKEGFTDPTIGSPALTTTLPAANTASPTSGNDVEISLDVEWAHVMAPQANILLVEGKPDFSDIFNGILAIDAAAKSMHIVALSMSFGGPENENLSSTANAEAVDGYYFDTAGLVYLASSGDSGAYASGTNTVTSQFPASSSNVLAVGGTTLSVSGTSYAGETTWGNGTGSGTNGGGGGGYSVYEPQPAYQVGKVNGLTTSARAYPDISLDADPSSGVSIYDSVDYGTGTGWSSYIWGGTSLASPLMAGLVAITDQGRAINGFSPLNSSGDSGVSASNRNGNSAALDIHNALYSLGYSNGDFHDITSGNSIGPASYGPISGYDLSTGIGSPAANHLLVDLSNVNSAPAISTQPTSQTVAATTLVSFTAAATGSPTPTVQWQYSTNNGTSYSAIAGATSTTYTFTAVAADTGYLYEAVFTNVLGSATTSAAKLTVTKPTTTTTIGSSNSSVGYGQSVTFTATVAPASGSGETGTVQFVIDGSNSGSPVTLGGNNTAAYTISSLTSGNHTVVADYSGDANFQSSQSSQISQTVALPAWLTLSVGAAVVWNPSAETLQINSGTATIVADPEESRFNNGAGDDPTITASGSGSKLEVAPTDGSLLVHISGITLQSGATADVASLGAARTHSNHRVLVVGTVNQTSAPTFSIDSQSALDLEDNDMIVHGGNNGSSDFAAVQAAAALGRNVAPGGTFDGTWNGNGLTSSVAGSVDIKAGYEQNILAVELNADRFLGKLPSWTVGNGTSSEPLRADGNDVLVKYTYLGDLNLSGAVDGNAATIFETFYKSGSGPGGTSPSLQSQGINDDYAFGDLNGDGYVDDTDATILETVFNNGTPGSGLPTL